MNLFAHRAMLLLTVVMSAASANSQYARHVDPFLGADAGGNVFPGPALPFGMIKPGPDMVAGENDPNAGWAAGGDIRGFSQTHVSGTGGGAKYGNILVMPTVGDISPLDSQSPRADEKASAGIYSVRVVRSSTIVEITAARRTALYRFTYPASTQSNLLFDVGHCLLSSVRHGESQSLTASEVSILSPTEVAGSSSVTGGWNKQPNSYTVYFYAMTDTPAESWGTWLNGHLLAEVKAVRGEAKTSSGAWLSLPTRAGQQVLMKISISFISIEQARRNAATEISGFNFAETQAAAVNAWDHALGKIELKGATDEQAQVFYTALYHTMLMPTDRSGENPLWESDEPYYDDYYAIWDIFRSSGPLLTLIAPDRESAIVRSLVDIYRHERWLPDARSGNYNGRVQGGSNAEFLITDAYVKGLQGIDWADAFAAEVHDAETPPIDHFKEGRGGLEDWHKLGYASVEGTDRPGSVSMEYAANDFEIALLAKGLGKTDAYDKYLKRSANWKNIWDSGFSASGFNGFIRPKHQDGSWLTPFTAMDVCSWGGTTFYEGNSWTYSFFVPHDVAALIKQVGGPQKFVERLDAFFDVPGRYDVGNEPGFLSPYLYIWAGRPDKTASRVREIIAASFHAGRDGLPGNDDSGAMSSWYAFGQIGLFPNAGQDIYLIGSPAFEETTIHLAGGRNFIVNAKNVSVENKYVVRAELNGKPLDRAWLHHREIAAGGHLTLVMGRNPSHWAEENPPPSASATQ
jgi:predicted alpha-1,2-mannosidase